MPSEAGCKRENDEEFVQGGNAEPGVSALAIGDDAGFLDSELVCRTFDADASEGKGADLALALGKADLEQIQPSLKYTDAFGMIDRALARRARAQNRVAIRGCRVAARAGWG